MSNTDGLYTDDGLARPSSAEFLAVGLFGAILFFGIFFLAIYSRCFSRQLKFNHVITCDLSILEYFGLSAKKAKYSI